MEVMNSYKQKTLSRDRVNFYKYFVLISLRCQLSQIPL